MANVSAQIVNPLDPASLVEGQRVARQQALADQLRQGATTPISYDPHGRISPWQGLSKITDAVGSAYMQKKVDGRTLALAQGLMRAKAGQFGFGQPQPAQGTPLVPPSSSFGALAPPASGTNGVPMSAIPQPGAPPQPGAAPPSPYGDYAPHVMDAPQPQSPNVLHGMTPQQSFEMSVLNPETYSKALEAQLAETPDMKNLAAAYGAGSPQYQQALQAIGKKAGFIPPTEIREGGLAIDNNKPGTFYTSPKTEVGMQNNRDPNTLQVTGQSDVPGAIDTIERIERARQIGKADATPVSGFGPDGQPAYTTGGAIVRGQGAPGGGGTLGGFYGRQGEPGGVRPGPPLGAASAANTAGGNSADQFNATISAGQGSQDAALSLSRIGELSNGLNTGPGTGRFADIKGGVNVLARSVGLGEPFNDANVAKVQEIQKLAATLAQQQSSALGGVKGATDARLSAAFASLPDANKAPGAIKEIVTYLKGNQAAIMGKSQAAAQWQQTHGPDSFPQFAATFQKAYDPRIYQWMQGGPAEVAKQVQKLPPPQRAKLLDSYRALKSLGAVQ